jgi:nicotinate-nucleotide adenylyltransferase
LTPVGLLGGAFDPPHNGHVALAGAAERELGLGEIVIVVVADPGHKDVHAPAETRLELARLAFPGRKVILDHHARTVDMLRDGPWDDPVFLVGADEYLDFRSWKEPEAVLELVRLGVATRPGFELPSPLPERVLFFEIEPVPVSSRDIRVRIARGEPIDGLVPPAVAAAIVGTGLYRG